MSYEQRLGMYGAVTRTQSRCTRKHSPTSTWRHVPVSRSHTRAVQSLDSVTARRPSWLTMAAFTPPLCTRLASRSPLFCRVHLNCSCTCVHIRTEPHRSQASLLADNGCEQQNSLPSAAQVDCTVLLSLRTLVTSQYTVGACSKLVAMP